MPKPKNVEQDEATPLLEWICGAIGLVLFLGAMAVTIINGLSPDEPPVIVVKAETAQPIDGGFRIEFEASNKGDETAALVKIVATLSDAASVVETHDIEIDFMPPHSSRRAGVIFTRNPGELSLEIKAVSYQHP